ncbi:MAG: aminopeptidase, partial [Pedobacter sp.]
EVQYKASSLFLDEGATKDQFISRSNLISHETAHMWFGDLVTMKWFNDVWMKEVFANFMADKVTEKLMGTSTFDLKFLQDHYPAAYGIDRTRGANPIRQQLDNLQEAGSMYGNIIYHKAPIMMRQLEQLMGEENFQNGIREYLNSYAYGNATWNDLISILNKFSSTDLLAWNRVWVNQPGRPVFQYKIIYNGNKIKQFRITQQAESGDDRVWPQAFKVKAFYSNTSKEVTVNMKGKSVDMDQFIGMEKPEFILFNSDGKGYGIFPFQQISLDSIIKRGNALERASAYINAYENVLSENSLTPLALLSLYSKGLMVEENEMNLRLLTGYISNLYWTFLSKNERDKYNPLLEAQLWEAMEKQVLPNHKKVLFTGYQNVYLSQAATANIHKIWKSKSAPSGVKLTEDDFTAMALSLALRTDTVNSVLQ